jgi:hypothetical protein
MTTAKQLKDSLTMVKIKEDIIRPLYAVTMWSDDNWIYVELPCDGEVPYICKFAFTEGGLSKALYVLRNARKNKPPSTVSADRGPDISGHIARITHPRLKRPVPQVTQQQRDNAREVLRKLKMLGK